MHPSEKALKQFMIAAGFANLTAVAWAAVWERHAFFKALRGETTPRRGSIIRLAKVLNASTGVIEQIFDEARASRASDE